MRPVLGRQCDQEDRGLAIVSPGSQIFLRPCVQCCEIKKIKVLADTGAGCNLFKKGFLPHHLTNVASQKKHLSSVTGQVLQGGKRKT